MAEVCVRVAARIRPLQPKEVLQRHEVCVRVVPGSSQVMLGSDRLFSFDHAFGPASTQDEVYEACVLPLVKPFLQGYNATVFCYGQTGSGKTYTLEGGSLAEEGGIIHRVAHDVFFLLNQKSQSAEIIEATVTVSYIELYCEELRDLLELQTVHKEMHIREDDRGNTVVAGANEVTVSSAEALFSIIETGNALRHTGTTAMNDKSSRSHAVLTLHLRQCIHDNDNNSICTSKLCLVDLAGSERPCKTGNSGTRLKESAHINTGLLALGNVIRALSDTSRSAHIPFRDAKITRLLRDSLGGTAHTLMVACVSPSSQSVAETVSVLQFAAKARHIRNRPGTTRTEVKPCTMTWDPGQARAGELEFEMQTLRELLKEKQKELQKERGKTKEGNVEDIFKQGGHKSKVCQDYYDLTQEAAALLAHVSPAIDDDVLKRKLDQWQERLEIVNKTRQTGEEDCLEKQRDHSRNVDVLRLEQELLQCKEALDINEEILQQKEEELRLLKQKVEKLNQDCSAHTQALHEEQERNHIKTEQLVNQQILIERLRGNTFKSSVFGTRESSASGNSERRAHSVPLPRQSCAHRPIRKIHSSPPVYSLERVMAAFKMRGQLLLAEMEEKEEVYCPLVKRQEKSQDIRQEAEGAEGDTFLSRMGFRRSLNHTWTNRHKKQKEESAGLSQEADGIEVIQLCQEWQHDQHIKPCQPNKIQLRSSVTQRRIQELSVNMRMKEELIKELEKTDELSRVMGGHVSGSADGRELGALARISQQSQQFRAQLYHSLQHMRQERAALQTNYQEDRETHRNNLHKQHQLQESQNRTIHKDEQWKLADESSWLEDEEERLLQRRAEMKELEEELRRREEVLQRREACLQHKNKLEIKKLRSSQVLSQDLLRMSLQLENLDKQIQKRNERRAKGVSIEELERERDTLQKKRQALEIQLQDSRVLTEEEEHCLLELEEGLETLDAALEFKNQCIQDKQERLCVNEPYAQKSSNIEDTHLQNIMVKLRELSPPEISDLFVKYFNKVVSLREAERSLRWQCEELELHTEEQESRLKEMERAMERLALDTDRRLMQQHREHQSNVQLLLSQIKEMASGEGQTDIQERLQHLEKELFFYKSSSRQLKKKLREFSAFQHSVNHSVNSPGPMTPREEVQAKTHIPTTYTRVHAEGAEESGRFSQQNPSPSSSSQLQVNRNLTSYSQLSLRQSNESNQNSQSGEKITQVRLCRRNLRQISPSRLQVSGSTTRGQQSIVDTSTETMLEDSIEVTRNADR